MPFGDVIDEFHDQHGLTHTGTTEQTNFTTFHIRLKQVDDFNTGRKHLLMSGEVFKLWSFSMDRITALHIEWLHTVNGLTNDIHHSTLDLFTSRHCDRTARRYNLQTALQSIGIVHSHTTHRVLTNMLLHFHDQITAIGSLYFQCLVNLRQYLFWILTLRVEIHVNNRPNDLRDTPVYL